MSSLSFLQFKKRRWYFFTVSGSLFSDAKLLLREKIRRLSAMNLTEGKRYEPVSKAEMCKYDHKDVSTTFRGVFMVLSKQQDFISFHTLFSVYAETSVKYSPLVHSGILRICIRSGSLVLNTVSVRLELHPTFSCHSFFPYSYFRVSYEGPNFNVPMLRKNVPKFLITKFLFRLPST
jgi:hypothetical protein